MKKYMVLVMVVVSCCVIQLGIMTSQMRAGQRSTAVGSKLTPEQRRAAQARRAQATQRAQAARAKRSAAIREKNKMQQELVAKRQQQQQAAIDRAKRSMTPAEICAKTGYCPYIPKSKQLAAPVAQPAEEVKVEEEVKFAAEPAVAVETLESLQEQSRQMDIKFNNLHASAKLYAEANDTENYARALADAHKTFEEWKALQAKIKELQVQQGK